MKTIGKILGATALSLGMAVGTLFAIAHTRNIGKEAKAYYSPSTTYSVSDTPEELATYYSSISDSLSGDDLLSALRSLNSSKKRTTIGYSGMGTSTSGAFIYTDYDLNSTTTDSNGQVYGTKVASFYTKTAATSWNREHMWPNSHGGNVVEGDILHTRPTISSENSSRGNSFYVEGKNSSTAGWDPYTAGYDAACRGECARVILYSVVASSQLSLIAADSHSTSNSNKDYLMGNMNTLIKWHFAYTPNVYEMNRNNGAEYIQGNRNPFVDHPEYVARIWSNFNSTVSSYCSEGESTYENWTPGAYSSYGTNDASGGSSSATPSLSLNKTSLSLTVGGSETLTATIKNGLGTVSWTSSNTSVATVNSSGKVTAVAAGTAVITASVTIDSKQYTKTCAVTVTESGGSSSGEDGDYSIVFTTNSDSSTPLGTNNFLSESIVSSNTLVSSVSEATKCYQGKSGLKLGSSSAIGSFTANTKTEAKNNVSSIKITSTVYGSDTGTLSLYINGSTTATKSGITVGEDYTHTFTTAQTISSFKIATSTKRAYVGSVSFTVGSASTKTLTGITLNTDNVTKTFYVGDEFSYDGLVVTASYDGASSATVTPTSVSSPDMSTAGSKTITVSYTEGSVTKTATYTITVKAAPTLDSLTVSGTPSTKTYYEGESFSSDGLTVTAHYSDSSTKDVTSDVIWTPSPLTVGTTSVTGMYQGETVTVSGITVSALTLTSIAVSNTTTSYYVGNDFVKPRVTATYNNGTSAIVTDSAEFSGFDMNVVGNYTVTVSYTEKGVTKTTTYSITVAAGKSSIQTAYETCAALSTQESDECTFTGTITGTVGKSFYVQDGDYGMYVYQKASATQYVSSSDVGKKVSVTSTLKKYSGIIETGTISDVTVSDELGSIAPKDVTNYNSIANLNQSILSNLSSGVVKELTQAGVANSKDLKLTITVGGQDIAVFASKYVGTMDDLNSVYNTLSVGDTISISNMVTSYYSSSMQLAMTEQTTITKGYSLSSFCLEFLNNLVCDSTGASAPTFASGYSWSELATLYAKLDTADQELLTESDANEHGADYEKVAARYDYIVAKYKYTNFMNRDVISLSNVMTLNNNNSGLLAIIISSVAAISSVGVFFILRKKKQDR